MSLTDSGNNTGGTRFTAEACLGLQWVSESPVKEWLYPDYRDSFWKQQQKEKCGLEESLDIIY